jgi:hypothetical protein
MTPDYRALCAELLQELCCHYRSWELKEGHCSDAMNRARAALAEPVGEGPSDEELLAMRSWSSHGSTFDSDLVDFARAVLARWGHPATPPAPEPGEVGEQHVSQPYKLPEPEELVAELELMASHAAAACQFGDAKILSDAATLLQQLSAPAPVVVPVSERPWEREGWCDEQGYCWFFSPRFNLWSWELPPSVLTPGIGRLLSCPAHALPLPQAGEVEA